MFRAYQVFSMLRPPRPRHPLVQALVVVFVICAFLALLVVGAVIGLVAMLVALVARAFGFGPRFAVRTGATAPPNQPQATPPGGEDVIDAEYRVVEKSLRQDPQA